MFKKKFRLAKTKDVKNAFARGRTFFSPFLTVKFFPAPTPRFTVVVSTKVDKRAVRRNRLKRIVREFLRLRLPALSRGDYAVVLKAQAAKADEKVLSQSLESLFKKSRLLI